MADVFGYDKATLGLTRLARDLVLDCYGDSDATDRRQLNLALLDYLSSQEKNQLIVEMLGKSGYDSSRHTQAKEDLQKAHQCEIEQLVSSHKTSLRKKQKDHDLKLKTKNEELDNANEKSEILEQQMRNLSAELDSREPLEVLLKRRQDVLLAVGEVLQMVARRQGVSIDELAGNVEAGLTLALRAGGADLLSTSAEGKVVAPGVVVRGGIHGDRVLLKAQVKHEAS